jgi:4-hydroxybenzoate polyprenyltransferase
MAQAAAVRPSVVRCLWRLSRPRFAFWLLWIPLIGYGFALWDRALDWVRPDALLLVLGGWLLLNAGTMWLNAALDRDEAGALFSQAAPLPPHLVWFGYAALALGIVVASAAHLGSGACAGACALLAVLYSHPVTAYKGRPVLGPAVNALGYGVLSALAGWVLVGVSINLRTAVTFALMTLWLLGVTFAAQAFQREDDARRGYRTFVVTHGPAASLRVARACTSGAVWITLALAALGWFPRISLLATPLFILADRWMLRWQQQPGGGDARWAAGLVQRMLLGGLAMFLLIYADYLYARRTGGPVAGDGTALGRR